MHVDVQVLPSYIEAFKSASAENAAESLKEPGVARFDVIQSNDRPDEFVLVEVYRKEADALSHKQTAHYSKWRDAVEPMMAKPRQSRKFTNVFPEDQAGPA